MYLQAITELEIWLYIYRNNYEINVKESNYDQADLEASIIQSIEDAIAILKSSN